MCNVVRPTLIWCFMIELKVRSKWVSVGQFFFMSYLFLASINLGYKVWRHDNRQPTYCLSTQTFSPPDIEFLYPPAQHPSPGQDTSTEDHPRCVRQTAEHIKVCRKPIHTNTPAANQGSSLDCCLLTSQCKQPGLSLWCSPHIRDKMLKADQTRRAPFLWNGLPTHVRDANSVSTFKSLLKTHLFSGSYDWV